MIVQATIQSLQFAAAAQIQPCEADIPVFDAQLRQFSTVGKVGDGADPPLTPVIAPIVDFTFHISEFPQD